MVGSLQVSSLQPKVRSLHTGRVRYLGKPSLAWQWMKERGIIYMRVGANWLGEAWSNLTMERNDGILYIYSNFTIITALPRQAWIHMFNYKSCYLPKLMAGLTNWWSDRLAKETHSHWKCVDLVWHCRRARYAWFDAKLKKCMCTKCSLAELAAWIYR